MQSQPPEFVPPVSEPEELRPPEGQAQPTAVFVPDPALAGMPPVVEPFAPPSDAWRRVSPKLTHVKRISMSIGLAILFIPVAVGLWLIIPPEESLLRWIAVVWLALGLALWVWRWFRTKRLVASYGWAQRDKDLCIVGGLMFRNLEVVPFGRMQVVKVSSGPLLRAYGLANVELVTASASTNGSIPGLPADEAKALRDLIIELSDAEGSGL